MRTDEVIDDIAWRVPSPRMWRARLTVVGSVCVIVFAAGVAASSIDGATATVATAVAVLVASALWLAIVHGRYRSWGYAERDDDLLVRRGLAFRRVSVVPYGRMQFIDVTAGPVDRMFGLATVQLHTAAAATNARIPGLARVEAERLRDALAALGEAHAAGL